MLTDRDLKLPEAKLLSDMGGRDLIIVSHDDLRKSQTLPGYVNFTSKVRFIRCVVDEVQDCDMIRGDNKTDKTQPKFFRLEVAYRVSAVYRWCLSGAPFRNEKDLFGVMRFLRHPLTEPLLLSSPETSTQEEGQWRNVMNRVGLGLLKPITVRQFERATFNAKKMTLVGLKARVMIPPKLDLPSRLLNFLSERTNGLLL